MSQKLPGKGLLGWLGRQVGYVRKAVQTDPAAPAAAPVLYRQDKVEEKDHPTDPSLKLRRTTTDEVVKKESRP